MSCTRKVVIINVVVLALFAGSVSGLTAPYLISATALNDTLVDLTWRNSDTATQGFVVFRKDSTDTAFKFVDSVKSATQAVYTDTNGLRAKTLYTYQIKAYGTAGVSDTSNSVYVTTLATAQIFKRPLFGISWDISSSESVRVTIVDSSNCEDGYLIFRDDNFSSHFSLISRIVSVKPKNIGDTIVWSDSTISFNKWYNYKVAVYKSSDSIFSKPCSTYTFRRVQPGQAVKFTKLSEIPLNYSLWSVKVGDSIILKENPSPAGKSTIINIKDPAAPKFDGYIDSSVLVNYPLQTLIPLILTNGLTTQTDKSYVAKLGENVLVTTDTLNMYHILNNQLLYVDHAYYHNGFLPLNDTLVAVRSYNYIQYFGSDEYLSLLKLSDSGLSSLTRYYFGFSDLGLTIHPYIHGVWDNNIFISMKNTKISGNGTDTLIILDVTKGRTMVYPVIKHVVNTIHTGLYFTPTENLCLVDSFGVRLFMSDVRDIYGYQTALANNAVYTDSDSEARYTRNILLDTLNKRVYLICASKLSILSYQQQIVGITDHQNKPLLTKEPSILSNAAHSGVTIILPTSSHHSDLYFYDLSGRVIDKMLNVTSNAVLWRPKTKSMGCFVVSVISGKKKFSERFLVK